MRALTRFLLFGLLVGSSATLHAYEPATHREITERALKVSAVDVVLKGELLFGAGIREAFSGLEVLNLTGTGAETEDKPVVRALNHFHNPLRSWGEAGLQLPLLGQIGQSSVLWQQNPAQDGVFGGGNWSWQDVRGHYLAALTGATKAQRERAFADTFRGLGQLTHLIQDASVPAHVRDDSHLIHEGYEKWVERIRVRRETRGLFDSLLNGAPVLPPGSIFTATDSAQAPLPIARLIDSDRFLGREAASLTDVDLGIAEYTNGNFLSDDTIFRNFALPRRESLGSNFFEQEGQGFRRYFEKAGEGEAVRHFVAESALYEPVNAEAGRPMEEALVLTRRVYQDYAEKLLPPAVGYSAALLDYFFRGKLDVDLVGDLDDPSLLRLTGTNASADALVDGDLTLYGDDARGERARLQALEPTAVRGVAAGQEMTSAPFRPSEDAERFVAVYQGTLGLEARDGTFPGGVIGKVLGGVRVEQVFADGVRWKIRTPRGVFLLPLMVAEFEEVRWGDAENALVARTGFGPGRPNRVAAYEVRREPGSAELATVDTPDGPEVTVTQKNEAVFPFGMSLGTTVHFSQTVEYRQQRLTYEHSSLFRWVAHDPTQPNAGNYEIANDEYGSVQVETAVNEVVPFAESFPLALDLERNAYFGTARNPYVWFLTETAVDASWRLLGVVAVRLRAPQTPGVTRPVLGPPDTPFAVVGMDLVAPWFPSEVDPLLWAIVDLKDGRVVASTAEPTITIVSRRTQETPVWLVPRTTGTIVWEHYFETREGGLRPGHEDSWWGYNIEARPEGRPVREVTEIHVLGDGDLSISVDGWLRGELKDELARHGLYGFQMGSGQTTLEFVYKAAGLRVTSSSSWIEQSPVQFSDARRARPAPGGERLVFMGQGQDDTGTVLVWAPGTASAKVLHQLRSGYHELGPATRATVLVFSKFYEPRERSGFLMPLEGTQAPIVFPGEDLTWSFTLLDPTYLYSVEDLRFYRLRSPLQRTALPARLADVPGRPVGDYHAIRLPGALTP